MSQQLFREEAFANRGRREPIDDPLRVTTPRDWLILSAFCLALIAVVMWGVFGRIDRVVSADCVMLLPGPRYILFSPVSGIVLETLGAVGDAVEVGEPIARIRSPELDQQLEIAKARVVALESEANDNSQNADDTELTVARYRLTELQSIQSDSQFIASPYQGELATLSLVAGQSVAVGESVATVRAGDNHEIQTVSFVPSEVASRISVGMRARIVTPGVDSVDRGAFAGEIIEISSRSTPVPNWLRQIGLNTIPYGSLITLTLDEDAPSGANDGDACIMHVTSDRVSPFAILGR